MASRCVRPPKPKNFCPRRPKRSPCGSSSSERTNCLSSRFPRCNSFCCASLLLISMLAIATVRAQEAPLDGDLLATKAFRAAAKRVAPSLVTVEAIGVLREDIQAVGRPATLRATGGVTTGLVLSADGYILTSTFGLGEKAPAITVILADGSRHL